MKSQLLIFILSIFTLFSCVSTKSTLKNVDNSLPNPIVKNNVFVLTEQADDAKYGYDEDYPINVFYMNSYNPTINIVRFLNALTGPNNATLTYSKLEVCCPFPTKNNQLGSGLLDVYEVTWEGNKTPLKLYFNIYEKGKLMAPLRLFIKK